MTKTELIARQALKNEKQAEEIEKYRTAIGWQLRQGCTAQLQLVANEFGIEPQQFRVITGTRETFSGDPRTRYPHKWEEIERLQAEQVEIKTAATAEAKARTDQIQARINAIWEEINAPTRVA